MDTVTLGELLLLAVASALVGFSKTAISGANTISLAVFAAVLPARESTGVILPLLLAGDVLAVLSYRRHAHWPTLLRLLPAVGVGVVLGTVFLAFADDRLVRLCIGGALLVFALWRLVPGTAGRRRQQPTPNGRRDGPEGAAGTEAGTGRRPSRPRDDDPPPDHSDVDSDVEAVEPPCSEGPGAQGSALSPGTGPHSRTPPKAGSETAVPAPAPAPGQAPQRQPARHARLRARAYGVLGGFTTMVANAAGPVMALYLLSAGFRKLSFLGTSAWFFLIVNVCKVPFSAGLGLIDRGSLLLDAALVVFVLPGALLGRACVGRLNQQLFERLVLAATVLGGLHLLLG